MSKKSEETWIPGHINWYDPDSGKGSIISDDGIWYRIHEFSEVQSKRKQVLKEQTRVEFELARDSVHPIIKAIRPGEKTRKEGRLKPRHAAKAKAL